MLGVNSSSCFRFIQVLGVCKYYFCSFCEVLGVITKIGEDSGKCYLVCRFARVLCVNKSNVEGP